MTASGLRQECNKGRLKLERIANKEFVTLRAIEEMRRLCALSIHPGSSGGSHARTNIKAASGSSSTEDGKSAQARARASARLLKSSSRNTSRKPANQSSATVIPLKS